MIINFYPVGIISLFSHLGTESSDALSIHSLGNSDVNVLSVIESLADLDAKIGVGGVLVRRLQVLTGLTGVLIKEGGEAILRDISQHVNNGGNDGSLHVSGRRGDLFVLLSSEDINTSDVRLSVTVLSGLGGGHLDDLAWEALEKDNLALLHLTSADGLGLGGISSCYLKMMCVSLCSHSTVLSSLPYKPFYIRYIMARFARGYSFSRGACQVWGPHIKTAQTCKITYSDADSLSRPYFHATHNNQLFWKSDAAGTASPNVPVWAKVSCSSSMSDTVKFVPAF